MCVRKLAFITESHPLKRCVSSAWMWVPSHFPYIARYGLFFYIVSYHTWSRFHISTYFLSDLIRMRLCELRRASIPYSESLDWRLSCVTFSRVYRWISPARNWRRYSRLASAISTDRLTEYLPTTVNVQLQFPIIDAYIKWGKTRAPLQTMILSFVLRFHMSS